MQRLFLISALCAGLFTGCATTSKLIPFVGSETPMQQVLKAQPEIVKEHNNTSVQQVFNRVESPTVSRITVIQTGLMDDSVSAIRTTYQFKFIDEQWNLVDKKAAYKCSRGKNTKTFQTAVCP